MVVQFLPLCMFLMVLLSCVGPPIKTLAVLSWLSCPCCPVRVVQTGLYSPGGLWLFFPIHSRPYCPVPVVLCWLAVLYQVAVLCRLSSPECPLLAILSWLFFPDCLVLVVLSQRVISTGPVMPFLSRVSCSSYPVPAILSSVAHGPAPCEDPPCGLHMWCVYTHIYM